jgi:hypothetical protein
MAKHDVVMSRPKDQVIRADIQFSVKVDGEKLGELHVSQGNVEWWPKGNKRNKRRLSWQKFAKLFEEERRPIYE